MSLVTFDGPEPITQRICSEERLIAHDLPTTEHIMANNFKKQKTDEEKKSTYRRGEDQEEEVKEGSLAVPIINNEEIRLEDAQDSIEDVSEHEMNEIREESMLLKKLISTATQIGDTNQASILQKLDSILDRRLSALSRRVSILEKETAKVLDLIRNGCRENDTFWGFDNYRPLKNWGAVAGMSDRTYAMIFDAIDFNNGVLRDNRLKKRAGSGARKY